MISALLLAADPMRRRATRVAKSFMPQRTTMVSYGRLSEHHDVGCVAGLVG